MKLIFYEFKKLCGVRYIWVLFAVVTAACAGLFCFTSGAAASDLEYIRVADDFFKEYESGSERISAAYGEYLDSIEKQKEVDRKLFEITEKDGATDEEKKAAILWADAERERLSYTDSLGFQRRDGEPVSDIRLFNDLRKALAADGEYRTKIGDIISNVENTIRFYESVGAGDDPACEYNRHFAKVYRRVLSETTLPAAYVHGWQKFYEYDEVSVFICIFMAFLTGAVFMNERSSGTLPIIRTAKNGRLKVTAAKLAIVFIMGVVAAAVMTGAVMLMCFLTFGFSSPSVPVQTVLTECPYSLTLGGYAGVMLLVRCVGTSLFSCFAALVSSLFFSHIVTYASSAVVTAANMALYFLLKPSNYIPFNLISVIFAHGLMSSYAEVRVFGHFRSTLITALILYFLLAAVMSVCILFGSGRPVVTLKIPFRGKRPISELRVHSRGARYPRSLFAWETAKLFTPVTTAAVVVLLVLSASDAEKTYSEYIPEATRVYEAYINDHVFGEYTDASRDYLLKRKAALETLTSDEGAEEMKGKYLAGEIEYQEYRMFLTQTGHAEAELKTVDRILKRADDLCHNGKNKSGTFWLVPETAISRILGRDMNVFLLFAILLIFSRIYSVDYAAKSSEDRFASILRTTRRGRRESFYAKAAAALLVSLAIAAAFVTIDLCIGVTACGTGRFFDILSAPVSSIEGYEAFGSMTVGVYLLSVVLLRFAACIIIAYLTCAASFAVKKLPPTLFLAATATLLPYTLVYMGVGVLRYVDITAMLSGGKLLTRSAEISLFGSTFGFACVLLCGWLAITAAAVLAVRQKTGK